ncbi:MAG TPA: RNA polymerase sigma factor [Polyangiaceae bacterium]|nr:RNA polymerase sigma factor [Polyangiaceae bacterium]
MSACATTPLALLASPDPSPGQRPHFAVPRPDVVPLTLLESLRPLTHARRLQGPPPGGHRVISGETPDDQLALAACEGDPRAAMAIWRRYGVQVRSKLVRWVGAHDLDDHVQEVFSRLFEQLPRLRQPNALRSFLIGITLRVACTELRRRRRWRLRLTATGELPDLPQPGADDGTGRQALSRFEGILEKLAPRTRRVFVLRYVEKLELVDVAAAMNISLATAKRHLARASVRVFAMAEREPTLAEYVRSLKLRAANGSDPAFS